MHREMLTQRALFCNTNCKKGHAESAIRMYMNTPLKHFGSHFVGVALVELQTLRVCNVSKAPYAKLFIALSHYKLYYLGQQTIIRHQMSSFRPDQSSM